MESAGHTFSALLGREKAQGRRLPDAEEAGLTDQEAGPCRDSPGKERRLVVPPLPHPARGDGHRDKERLRGRVQGAHHGKGHPAPVPVRILLPPRKLEPVDRRRKAPVGKDPGSPRKRVGSISNRKMAVLPGKKLRQVLTGIADQGPERLYRPVTDRASPRKEEILRRIKKLAGCHEFCPSTRSFSGSLRCFPPCPGMPSRSR